MTRPGWRLAAALGLFSVALLAFAAGVDVSERPGLPEAGLLTQAYFALGLFVIGGLDIGLPTGGPLLARTALWAVYFGAPLLFASAVLEALLRLLTPELWKLQRMRDHLVVVGVGDLSMSYLRVFRARHPHTPIVVVDEAIDPIREQELIETFNVQVVHGEIGHDYILRALRLDHARRVALLGNDTFTAFEAATRMLAMHPGVAQRVLLHCSNLRFMRSMQDTEVGRLSTPFNVYHLAAAALVQEALLEHFQQTRERDVVVMAGFGRFGQSVLEELDRTASAEIDTVVVIDTDADRRIQVVDEQGRIALHAQQIILQGDISHPQVWRDLAERVDLRQGSPTIILGTGQPAENLRTALWLRRQFADALILARTNDDSAFANRVGAENGIHSISITGLVERHMPDDWLD